MAFKKPTAPVSVPESPERLFRDLPRRKHASVLDHQGQILRSYTQTALNKPDVALQLPTGSGKTLVGLLLAEWRRRKFGERIVYLCPTRQLVNQVVDEANLKYGLSVEAFVGAKSEFTVAAKAAYHNAERVAVTTYSALFNTNPFFDTPEVIIVDDAHAAENYIASQWTLQISRSDGNQKELFRAVAGALKSAIDDLSYERLTSNAQSINDMTWVDKVPTAALGAIAAELRGVIEANIGDGKASYRWRMLRNHLAACQIYLSASEILIRPLIPPTWAHAPFAGAKQRIFMSATLGGGGDLERLSGRSSITRLPVPEGWDRQGIGRRFFIFPEKSLDEADVLSLRRTLMREAGRSLVLTPSDRAAEAVKEDCEGTLKFPVFSGSDLEDRKNEFTGAAKAVAVVANRYDGIDLPDDDCRLLFVEGLPRAANLQERFLMARMGANLLFNERVQTRVLQAVGRCTRGLNDYSAVVVTGENLPAYLTDRNRRSHFHPELQAELDFGIQQSTEVANQDILDNFRIFLEHEADWEEANAGILETRDRVTQADFPAMDELAEAARQEIAWQKAMWNSDYAKAFESAREVLGKLTHADLRGYRALWHYLAGSSATLAAVNGDATFEDAARSQFRYAKEASSGIPWLIGLSRGAAAPTPEEREQATVMAQVERLEVYLQRLGTIHNRDFTARETTIREGLATGADFEFAQVLLGEHLGFEAGNREDDASPDPWWRAGEVAIVFEDHANAGPDAVIDATKARQAASHPDWLREHVPGVVGGTIHSVLVTPAKKAKSGAAPHLGRVAYWNVDEFRDWAYAALDGVRDLRRTFTEPGRLDWRADAAQALESLKADAPGLAAWLASRPARDHLTIVK